MVYYNSLKLTFNILLLLQEVGSIIGKKGEIVKRFREEVNINIIFLRDGSLLIARLLTAIMVA